jgi:hypothetical protein
MRTWCIAACVLFAATTCFANQTLFYSGPDQLTYGNFNLPSVSGGFAVTDQFSVVDSQVTEIGFSAWIPTGNVPTDVSWAITTSPGLSDVLESGTSSLSTSLTATGMEGGNDVFWSTFSVNFNLPAGTYWLWLSHGQPELNGALGWGYTSNTGVSEDFFDDGTFRLLLGGTQSFALYGNATTTPEPGSMLLLIVGGLTVVARRHKRQE